MHTLRKVRRKGSATTVNGFSTLVTPASPSTAITSTFAPITARPDSPNVVSWLGKADRNSPFSNHHWTSDTITRTATSYAYPSFTPADLSALHMAPALERQVAEPSLTSNSAPGQPGYVYHPPIWS
ncbi:hypothetical protein RvY_18947 [Ramazzottius varieornatus]|uniref:Uncharacterized protein n=1 Tax=Ramazzottius varieornatus TaxID=947166 RepID=A0A1D1W7N5_RAMVA|nr:hypothetical protein RvY_18947 [Ramazzottius varieornatus]